MIVSMVYFARIDSTNRICGEQAIKAQDLRHETFRVYKCKGDRTVKKIIYLLLSAVLLLAAAGCSSTDKTVLSEPASEPIELGVSDLKDILSSLDISDAVLTFYGENEDTRPANAAIRVENYVKELQDYTWESCQVPAEWEINDGYRCAFTCESLSLTAYQSGYGNTRPFHVITESGEGWFTLPMIHAGQSGAPEQFSWMLFDTFEKWYQEAKAADLYKSTGTPLTAEELTWFQDYTASVNTCYDEERGGYIVGSTAVSCFFTSKYRDPRDMDATEFLSYCPGSGNLGAEDEKEFQLVQEKLDWRSGEDDHLFSVTEMPVPCHRFPRTYINEILTQYAGVTVEEMHTDWKEAAFYIPETDCFYTFTSDFGPGTFIPCYGERDGDVVTLWEAPNAYDENTTDVLTLQKSGDRWLILSHQAGA